MHTAFPYRSCLLLAVLTAGCATAPSSTPVQEKVAVPVPGYIPVVRYGRYTLVELNPTAAQQDLLLQVVNVSVPDTLHASVGDALRHVLRRSGYQLCKGGESAALNSLPLPAAHYQIGPMQLRDALLILVGPVRALQIDHAARHVCFSQPLHTPAEPMPQQPAPAPDAGTQGEAEERP
jgi:conjugative transfer region protein (TIGR03748 family)